MKHFTNKLLLLLFSSSVFSINLFASASSFIIGVQTNNIGSSADNQFTIPTHSDSVYHYLVDCDYDGTYETSMFVDGNYTCTYPPGSATTQLIAIDGDFPRIYFNNEGDKNKITSVEQWGSQQWESMAYAFNGALRLVYIGGTAPDLSEMTDMSNMFANASSLEFTPNINDWNVSTIELMSGVFGGATKFNQNISDWNVSNVTIMQYMFLNAENFNQDISNWDISNVTNMSLMFYGASMFNQDIGNWNVSKVGQMGSMFKGALSFNQDIGDWDISKASYMASMFDEVQLSVSDYDNMLISWNNLTLKDNVTFDAGYTRYCNGSSAKSSIELTNFWTITDEGEFCDFYISSPYTMNVSSEQQTVGTVTSYGGAQEYSIAGGADGDKFTIDQDSGVLSFIIAPDINNPTDKNEDNIYRVRVRANNPIDEDFQTIRVKVTNSGALIPIINYLLF